MHTKKIKRKYTKRGGVLGRKMIANRIQSVKKRLATKGEQMSSDSTNYRSANPKAPRWRRAASSAKGRFGRSLQRLGPTQTAGNPGTNTQNAGPPVQNAASPGPNVAGPPVQNAASPGPNVAGLSAVSSAEASSVNQVPSGPNVAGLSAVSSAEASSVNQVPSGSNVPGLSAIPSAETSADTPVPIAEAAGPSSATPVSNDKRAEKNDFAEVGVTGVHRTVTSDSASISEINVPNAQRAAQSTRGAPFNEKSKIAAAFKQISAIADNLVIDMGGDVEKAETVSEAKSSSIPVAVARPASNLHPGEINNAISAISVPIAKADQANAVSK
jgi:hypothetical protein